MILFNFNIFIIDTLFSKMNEGKQININQKKGLKFFNKRIILTIKIIFTLFLFYKTIYNNQKFIEKLSFDFMNINNYKETIKLSEGGLLEIFENKDKTIEIDTKNGKIYKSEILFLSVPGGSYRKLGKPERLPIAKRLFFMGYSSAILLYSIYPEGYPTNYNQGLQAIKILSSRFKKIILIGFSAGGHLTGLLGTTERSKLYNTIGMILCYPVISFYKNAHENSRKNFFGDRYENNEENQKLFSIENRVNSNTLPTFIWTIKNDKIVPYENTLYMIEKLKENNVLFESKIFEKGRHGMALADKTAIRYGIKEYKNKEVAKWLGLAINFIENILKNN